MKVSFSHWALYILDAYVEVIYLKKLLLMIASAFLK